MSTIGLVISDGGLSAVLDLTAGAVLFTNPSGSPFNTDSGADRFPSGLFAFGNNAETGPLTIWQWLGATMFLNIATVAAPMGMVGDWNALSANGPAMWAADDSAGLTTPTFRKFDQTGLVLLSVGPITALTNGVQAMTPSLDESVMYYAAGVSGGPIKRWTLGTDMGAADLVSPADIVIGMWPVPSPSTDLVVVTQTAYTGSAPVLVKAIRYTNTGTVVYTATLATLPASAMDTTIQVARDPSLTSIWLRLPAAPAYLQTIASLYLNVDLLGGDLVSSVVIPWTPPIGYYSALYGLPPTGTAYPFVILGNTPTPCGAVS